MVFTDSDLLTGIVNIPENMRHKKVELIVLLYNEDGKEKIKKGIKNLFGDVIFS